MSKGETVPDLVRLIQGSAHHLPSVADGSVQTIVTSPPYFALRSYAGEQQVEWPAVEYAPMVGLPPITIPAMKATLGLEPTIEAYIGHLMLCLREWRRVLRADGTLWVNLGDSFSAGRGTRSNNNGTGATTMGWTGQRPETLNGVAGMQLPSVDVGLPPKNLMMVPARFALAAQADGWYVRSDIIWAKENCMPESVTDRPTKSHEYLYLLSKSPVYFYDDEAIKEKPTTQGNGKGATGRGSQAYAVASGIKGNPQQDHSGWRGDSRNKRTVWTINTSPYPDAHFATFPEKLPETCILAGTSERGCCPQCGTPWERMIEKESRYTRRQGRGQPNGVMPQVDSSGWEPPVITEKGWQPTCKCDAGEPVPCVVLDAFSGSGTTGRVAVRLGRRYIGVDISQEYLEQLVPERLKVQMELLGTR